jgi:predicted pyridoxine 5'-phosphate oxidase superfamily flavin-nucleotide-binding protein
VGILTDDMQRVVREQTLGFVATVCPDGTPNVSPKGTTTVWDDDHLIFADIRSPQTIRNLKSNAAVEVNVVDPILRKGYRFKGTATVYTKDDEPFADAVRFFDEWGLEAASDRIHNIVLIAVETALPLTSPAYDSGRTEDDIKASYLARLDERLGRSTRSR